MSKKYKTIYADPPWYAVGGGKIKRGSDKHYPLMKTKDILKLPIEKISNDNAHLYLWVTNNFLPDGLKVMEAWGFRYITVITWVKDRQGLGQYYRGQTEQCLFGVKGMLPYRIKNGKRQQGLTVIDETPRALFAPRKDHSQKPEEMRWMIEKVSHAPRIELFARKKTQDWDVWGNEVESDIKIN